MLLHSIAIETILALTKLLSKIKQLSLASEIQSIQKRYLDLLILSSVTSFWDGGNEARTLVQAAPRSNLKHAESHGHRCSRRKPCLFESGSLNGSAIQGSY